MKKIDYFCAAAYAQSGLPVCSSSARTTKITPFGSFARIYFCIHSSHFKDSNKSLIVDNDSSISHTRSGQKFGVLTCYEQNSRLFVDTTYPMIL